MTWNQTTRSARWLVGAAVLLVAGGCAAAPGSVSSGPSPASRVAPEVLASVPAGSPLRSQTLEPSDMWLRHYAISGQTDSLQLSLTEKSKIRPKDELHRMLQHGLVLHQAGKFEESNQLFEAAEREADVRYSKSVSQMGLSLVTSDNAMDYTPTRAEISMIPYYRMLNYLRLNDVESAVVEARKANAYMLRLEAGVGDSCRESNFLKYFSGLVFEMGGEYNDAVVSMRQAEAGYNACAATFGFGAPASFGKDLHRVAKRAGLDEVASQAAQRYGVKSEPGNKGGEVVVLVENGFVAHRAAQTIHFPIFDEDVAGLNVRDPLQLFAVTGLLTGRVVTGLVERGLWGAALNDDLAVQLGQAAASAYIMKLEWPVYRLEAARASSVRALVGGTAVDAVIAQDVSSEVARDFEVKRKVVIARAIGRGVSKYVLTKTAEAEAEKKNAFLGLAVGLIGNIASNALENADTRSWSLLPDQISIVRVQLPEGEHEVKVEVGGDTVNLGPVKVQAGRTAILNHRVYGSAAGGQDRLAKALAGVQYAEMSNEEGQTVAVNVPAAPSRPASSSATAAPAPAQAPAAAPQAAPVVQPLFSDGRRSHTKGLILTGRMVTVSQASDELEYTQSAIGFGGEVGLGLTPSLAVLAGMDMTVGEDHDLDYMSNVGLDLTARYSLLSEQSSFRPFVQGGWTTITSTYDDYDVEFTMSGWTGGAGFAWYPISAFAFTGQVDYTSGAMTQFISRGNEREVDFPVNSTRLSVGISLVP